MAKTSLLMFPIYGMGAILPEISGLVDWWLGGERLDWMDRVIRRKGQILRSTPNTAPLICGACNTQPEGLSTMA